MMRIGFAAGDILLHVFPFGEAGLLVIHIILYEGVYSHKHNIFLC